MSSCINKVDGILMGRHPLLARGCLVTDLKIHLKDILSPVGSFSGSLHPFALICIDPPFLIQNPWSIRLAMNPAFLPKMSFYPETTSPLERGLHLMCPVSAQHIYLQRRVSDF